MKPAELKIGGHYWVAGHGPMRVAEFCNDRVVRCQTLDRINYWAGYEQLVREIGRDEIDKHIELLKAKGIVPASYTAALFEREEGE